MILQVNVFTNALKLMIDKFVLGIPNFVMAVVVAILGVLFSKTIAKVTQTVLVKLNLDRFGEKLNEIEFVYKSGLKIKISSILSKIVYYFLLLLFIVAATDILGMPALSNLVVSTIEFIPNLVVALLIMIFGLLGADALRKAVLTTCNSLGIPSAKVISIFVFYFVFITIFIMALSQAKINTAFLSQNISIIIGGAVFAFSLGYGLASKEVVSNFLASLYSKDRVKIGDYIKFDGIEGQVTDVDKQSITVATEKSMIIIPINKLLRENIEVLK